MKNQIKYHQNNSFNINNIMFIMFMLLITMISLSASEIHHKNRNNLDSSSSYNNNMNNNNNRLYKEIDSSAEHDIIADSTVDDDNQDDSDDGDDGIEMENVHQYNIDEEIHPQLFAAYHESYITKEAAKKLRQKIKTHKKPYTEKEYDDLLQEIILQQEYNPKNDIYDKKYFDYLPAEENIDDVESIEKLDDSMAGTPTTTTTATESSSNKKNNKHNKRSKRDVYFNDANLDQYHGKVKRQPKAIFLIQSEPTINPFMYNNPIYNTNNMNPWAFAGSQKYLNNFYLPPPAPISHGYYYPRPQIPFPSPPQIPNGVYFNAPFPPHNPNIDTVQPTPPTPTTSTTTTVGDLDNRFNPVWDVEYDNEFGTNMIGGRPISSVSRPKPPPLMHSTSNAANNNNNINRPNSNVNRPNFINNNVQGLTTTTTRRPPPPPLLHNSDIDEDNYDDDDDDTSSSSVRIQPSASPINNNQLGFGSDNAPIWSTSNDDFISRPNRPNNIQTPQQSVFSSQQRPTVSRPLPATVPPPSFSQSSPPASNNNNNNITRCILGIVNCCSRRNVAVRYACFEKLGCTGSFWDINPCRQDILDAAISQADKYFD